MLGVEHEFTTRKLRTVLDARGEYYAKSASSKSRLHYLVGRRQRELLSYEKYPVAELRGFAKARLLQAAPQWKADLVRFLEAEDEKATFVGFLDLLAELRILLYEFHIASLQAMHNRLAWRSMAHPPLCLASRQLRHEALPTFISFCMFHLQLLDVTSRKGADVPAAQAFRLVINPTSSINGLSECSLSLVRRIRITISGGSNREIDRTTWHLDVDDQNGFQQLPEQATPKAWSGPIKEAVERVVEDLKTRDGKPQFRRSDLESLRAAMETGLGGRG